MVKATGRIEIVAFRLLNSPPLVVLNDGSSHDHEELQLLVCGESGVPFYFKGCRVLLPGGLQGSVVGSLKSALLVTADRSGKVARIARDEAFHLPTPPYAYGSR